LYDSSLEARLPGVDRRELVGRLEELLDAERPERVYIPSPSYHQDHVVMFEAGLAATRPLSRKGYLARMVSAYEYPGSAWGYEGRELDLNHYVDIASAMEAKLAAVSIYNQGSQRGRAIIDPEVVKGWARLRGAFVGVEYAEAFRLLRLLT
jgi:LmbE family N-acetylglucosaminyl deacetylase